jgi:hypothetical protein
MRRKSKDEQQKESQNGEVELADDDVDREKIWNRSLRGNDMPPT